MTFAAPRIATVFGGSGFLGHAVVQALAADGYCVRVPTRDLEKAKGLRLMGTLGQVEPMEARVRSDACVAAAVAGAELVVNLIGIAHEKGTMNFQTAHVETAARLARIARSEGVRDFVHVSALGASMDQASRYARTKAVGEEAVRAFFPSCVILRPAVMFGPRDRFLNRLADFVRFSPVLPLIGGGYNRLQPVYVGDVAAALVAALKKPEARGRIFALGGPKRYCFQDIAVLLLGVMGLRRWLLSVPFLAASCAARVAGLLPEPLLTRDQVELCKTDALVTVRPAPSLASGRGLATIEMLGITPTPLEKILPLYVENYDPTRK